MPERFLLLFLLLNSSIGFAEIRGAFTFTSDYVWRGYTKSARHFALQVNLDYEDVSGIFLGSSASTVDFGDHGFTNRAQFEITPYFGWSTTVTGDWRLDIQWTRYIYDGNILGQESDYNEFYALVHYSDVVTGKASFSEDFYNRGHPAGNVELGGRYPFSDRFEISGNLGYNLSKEASEYDYLYWNMGLSAYLSNLVLDMRYFDAFETAESSPSQNSGSHESFLGIIDSTLVFSITLGF